MKRKRNAIVLLLALTLGIYPLGGCTDKSKKSPSSEPPVSSQVPSSAIEAVPSSEPISSQEEKEVFVMPDQTSKEPVAIDLEIANHLGDLSPYENEKKGWGQGKQVNEENRPLTCDLYQPKYEEYGGLFIMPNDEKNIYLTFDEGYENGYTEVILDALKEKAVPAVFFVTMPYVKANPDLVKRMVDEGHVLGNHSVKHKSMPTLTPEEQVAEIAGLHNYMVENYSYQMSLFRPPMGEYSTQSMYIANQLGYKTVLWSYAYLDYDVKNQMGVDKAFPRVTGAAHNGAVYLLHAVSKDNSQMLPEVIDKIREDGFTLARLE